MSRQAVVPLGWGSAAGGPGGARGAGGRSGRISASFAGVASDNYWSSTTNEDNPNNAWNANLDNGNVNNNDKDNTLRVWPVRGGAWRPCGP